MAVKYGPKGLAALCKNAKLEVNSCKEIVERHPETDVSENCDDMEKVSSMEKNGEIEEGRCPDARLRVCVDGKEETKNADLDDPSIIFVEEVRGNSEIVEAAENMRGSLKEASENLFKPAGSELVNSENNEVISPNLLHCSLSKYKKTSMDQNFGFLEKETESAKSNKSYLLVDKVDSGVLLSSSPLPPRAGSFVNVLDHLNDSIESLLKKLSPIKPMPSSNELLSPVAGCSRQATTDNLSRNLSPEKFLSSPNSTLKSGEIRLSRKSLVRTKSTPELSFILDEPSSPLLSPLSLFDRIPVSPKNALTSPEKKRIRTAVFKRQASTPEVPTSRIVRRFEELDSNVKILKTKNITPMPVYDLMGEKELKVYSLSFLDQYHILIANAEKLAFIDCFFV